MVKDCLSRFVQEQLWNQVPVAIALIDRDFRISEINTAFKEQYGDGVGRPCYEVYKDRDSRCKNCAAAKSFADGKTRIREEKGRIDHGEQRYYIVHMVPLRQPDGHIPCIVEMSTDITLTKRLEHEKIEAERLAAVGQTVAGLAHGIKNVLMGLEGGMYVMHSGMERRDDERIERGWQMLEDNVTRISTFVKEFLQFARGHTPKVKLVDPNKIVQKVYDTFYEKASQAGIGLRLNIQEKIPMVMMDEMGIHDCVANLVSNALDACEISDKPGRSVTLSTFDEHGALVIEVADDGVGMDYEVKKKVFTNFFSTKGSDKGTGLGLLTTSKIVQQHGGKVSVESEQGKGSVFRLVFPRDKLPSLESKVQE